MTSKRVAVAEVARPHGIEGELRVRVYNDESELLATKPAIVLALADGSERAASIQSVRGTNKAVLMRLAGVDDRNQAELLRGAKILVSRDALPPLEDGEFYACDLEGARAVLPDGVEVGRVVGLESYPTCQVLLVDRGGGKKLEVPLLDAYVARVDAGAGRVELVTIEGLT